MKARVVVVILLIIFSMIRHPARRGGASRIRFIFKRSGSLMHRRHQPAQA